MKNLFISGSIIVFIIFMGCMPVEQDREGALIWLDNGILQAGILSEVGGRMVFLGREEGVNLLKSDTALWSEPESERIIPNPFAGMKPYFGHIIWPGPQSGWWSNQALNQERKAANAAWPPDPYLIYPPYKILEHNTTSVILEGPSSPVSGIKLTKKYSLSDSSLEIEVCMTNTSSGPVSWDIWSNARFEGDTRFFVPGGEKGFLRITGEENERSGRLDPLFIDGAFTFESTPPGPGQNRRYGKAFLHPEKGSIVAVRDECMLVMAFETVEKDMIHPDQGFVEIYKMISRSGRGDLLELEHHSAFKTLQPGESFTVDEQWTLHAYKEGQEIRDDMEYYKQIQEDNE